MGELRWILLAAGILVIAGIYLWGLRSGRRSATRDGERAMRVEAPAVSRPAAAPRIEPGFGPADAAVATHEPAESVAFDAGRAPAPRTGPAVRREPRIESPPQPQAPGPAREPVAGAGEEAAGSQQIIALRIVAPPPSVFEGASLREAIEAAGLVFGRYQIFHRLDAVGQPVFSVASLREPGTFDLSTMDRASFRGVALFAVLPGPLPGSDAFDALIEAARAIAGRLGGLLQDERGVALGPVRTAELRESAAAFAYVRATAPDG
jgi:cell division protein ZipA